MKIVEPSVDNSGLEQGSTVHLLSVILLSSSYQNDISFLPLDCFSFSTLDQFLQFFASSIYRARARAIFKIEISN